MELLNTRVFDETAVGWEATIDKSIQQERYLRASFLLTQLSSTSTLMPDLVLCRIPKLFHFAQGHGLIRGSYYLVHGVLIRFGLERWIRFHNHSAGLALKLGF
jgi:hypothetical protein